MQAKIRNTFRNYNAKGENGYKHFSILVPVTGDSLLYEVRADKLDRQPGEICFPGGMIEEGESPLECALRETEEEMGISSEYVEVITKLDSVFSASGSQIHCFLGIIDSRAKAVPNEEVAEYFTVKIKKIMMKAPEMYFSSLIQQPDPDFPYNRVTKGEPYPWRSCRAAVPVYEIMDDRGKNRIIWGLTGRITKQFVEVLKCSD